MTSVKTLLLLIVGITFTGKPVYPIDRCSTLFDNLSKNSIRYLFSKNTHKDSTAIQSIAPQTLAISHLSETLSNEEFELFFNEPILTEQIVNEVRTGASLALNKHWIEKSYEYPIDLKTASLFKSNLFINSFYASRVYAARQLGIGQTEASLNLFSTNQAWLEWQENQNKYVFHAEGAQIKILEGLGNITITRFGKNIELIVLRAIKELQGQPNSIRRELIYEAIHEIESKWETTPQTKKLLQNIVLNLSTPYQLLKREHLQNAAKILANTFQQMKRRGIFTAYIDKTELQVSTTAWDQILEFNIDFNKIPKEIKNGIYIGIERNYIEIAFYSDEAKMYLAEHLQFSTDLATKNIVSE